MQASQLVAITDNLSFVVALSNHVPPWMYWALVTPLILRLSGRFRLERDTWPSSLAIHLMVNVVLSSIHLVGFVFWMRATSTLPFVVNNPLSVVMYKLVIKNVHIELLTYWGVVAAAHAIDYHRQFRERAVTAAQLATQLAQAQLEALKMQLHPHFLFNTLNAIAVLVRKQDTQGSIRMLMGLSDLLRLALETGDRQLVPLKQELDFAQRYLDIERVRFQDRMSVTTEIAPETLGATVPNLMLQPLVENAIRHGISARSEPGTIEIRASREGDRLVLVVRDDGNGLRDGWRPGVGMSNVRARLAQLYPGRHRLELVKDERGGTRVTVEIPWERTAS